MVHERLAAGRAVRVEPVGSAGEMVICDIAPSVDRFVRQLPVSAGPMEPTPDVTRPEPAVVADFSGGNGTSKVDQYPGIPGSGWATGWRLDAISEAESTASVESTDPLLGGDGHRLAERHDVGDGGGDELRRVTV